jgi:hypothetical protein
MVLRTELTEAPAMSPSAEEKAYPTAVDSKKTYNNTLSTASSSTTPHIATHKRQEHKDLAPQPNVRVLRRIPTERRESGQDDQDDAQSVPEREGSVNEEFLGDGLASVLGLDDVVDLGYGGRDEEGEDERGDVPYRWKDISGWNEMEGEKVLTVMSPKPNVGKVQDGQQGEPPLNAINDDRLASLSCNAPTT